MLRHFYNSNRSDWDFPTVTDLSFTADCFQAFSKSSTRLLEPFKPRCLVFACISFEMLTSLTSFANRVHRALRGRLFTSKTLDPFMQRLLLLIPLPSKDRLSTCAATSWSTMEWWQLQLLRCILHPTHSHHRTCVVPLQLIATPKVLGIDPAKIDWSHPLWPIANKRCTPAPPFCICACSGSSILPQRIHG